MWFKQGQIEVECGDENGYGSGECGDECGDGDAEKTNFAAIPPPPLPPPLPPPNNQSKPIVPTPSYSLLFPLITSSYIIVVSISSNSLSFPLITFRYTSYNFSLYYHNLQFQHYNLQLYSL